MSQDTQLAHLRTLVLQFSANIDQYKNSHYDESNTRTDYIDKFYTFLGWDVANNKGFPETHRDVVRENKVKIDNSQKAPDYSFRVGGARKFFVEAKKPSVNIKEAGDPAYQVRRYAYTAKLPLSILTNFEEFAVYDTRIKPNKDDKASVGRIFYCTFDQYEQNFNFIFNTFSKEAVLKGSFDKYAEANKNKKGTSEVDEELFALVEDWRIELAKKIARDNPSLNIYDLNTVEQRIIDRIIFLRIAEDKGIEDENLLFTVSRTENIYEKLIQVFTKANAKYNSGLFAETEWIDNIHVDDKVLKNIIVNLYYPECPYEFSVLPIEILGSIYERFLGKTIYFRGVKGDSRTAIIEEKPEVKKAGGVYYTPQYIVDSIVKNTVGGKIKNKTPDEIALIKICDPACGSGSFLVGAYQFLLNNHLDYYSKDKNLNSALKNKKIYESGVKSYKLTIEEKQRILTNCIYGVDIDSQAVEVTKLSLYLKLLENEGLTLLPSLENNIKCGNSLIGNDFYTQGNLDFTDEDRIKVNCFDWEKEFSGIFKKGGFDIVIGNPPYCNYSARNSLFAYYEKNDMKNEYEHLMKVNSYCKKEYADSSNGVTDIYKWFIHKALKLIKKNGSIGFIIPDTFIKLESYEDVRLLLKKNFEFNLYGFGVFQNVVVSSGILFYPKSADHSKKENTLSIKKDFVLQDIAQFREGEHIPRSELTKNSALMPVTDSKEMARYYTEPSVHYYKQKSVFTITNGNRIIVRKTGYAIVASLVSGESYVIQNLYQSVIIKNYSEKFILGLLNSKYLTMYYRTVLNPDTKGVFAQFRLGGLNKLPVPPLDLTKKADKTKHDKLVSLVDKMFELKQKEAAEKSDQLKTMISRQIDGIDTAIDNAVYELYNLTQDEIKIVKGE